MGGRDVPEVGFPEVGLPEGANGHTEFNHPIGMVEYRIPSRSHRTPNAPSDCPAAVVYPTSPGM